jgi:hypothetical protein
MIKVRDESKWYWNAVRGLCIILVILIHVTVPLNEDGIILPEWYLVRKLTAFPVAVFFFMAGYFVHIEKIEEAGYLGVKIKRVLLPYILFSILYIVLNNILGSNVNWYGILASFLWGTSEVQMYFCVYLMQMILLLPIIRKCIIISCHRNIWIMIVLLLSCFTSYLMLYRGVYVSVLKLLCLRFLIYYVFGIYVRGIQEGYYQSVLFNITKTVRIRGLVLMGFCLLALSCIEGIIRFQNIQYGQTTLGNYPYAIAVIIIMYELSRRHPLTVGGYRTS